MKKQLLLPILFIALLFSGCKDPDDDVDMPVPEKSVEELIQGSWFNDYLIIRDYDYATRDSLGALLKETKRAYDPYDPYSDRRHYRFDKEGMWEEYNPYDDGATYTIIDSAGTNYIKIIDNLDENKEFPEVYEITAISDIAMTWQQVERTDKLEGENKWKKTIITREFTIQ